MRDRSITYLEPGPKAGVHFFELELRGRGTWRVRVVFPDSLLTSVQPGVDYRPEDRMVELGFWRISELLIRPDESPELIELRFPGNYRLPRGEVLDNVARAITKDKQGRSVYDP